MDGLILSNRVLRLGMGGAQRRVKRREEAKREQGSKKVALNARGESMDPAAEDILQKQDDNARRIYRAGGKPQSGARTERRASKKQGKWRQGHQ